MLIWNMTVKEIGLECETKKKKLVVLRCKEWSDNYGVVRFRLILRKVNGLIKLGDIQ